jgi:hypothetical protein
VGPRRRERDTPSEQKPRGARRRRQHKRWAQEGGWPDRSLRAAVEQHEQREEVARMNDESAEILTAEILRGY